MSTRPGAPAGVEDILTEILGELRAINAKLAQAMEPARFTVDPNVVKTGPSTLRFVAEPDTVITYKGAS